MPCLPLSSFPSPSPHFFPQLQLPVQGVPHNTLGVNQQLSLCEASGTAAPGSAHVLRTHRACVSSGPWGPASPWLWPVASSRSQSSSGCEMNQEDVCQHHSKEKCQHSMSLYPPPQHSWPRVNIYARISQPQQHRHLGQIIWAVLSIMGYLEDSLTSKHLTPTAPSPPIWDNQKCLQTLSNVLWKAKLAQVENLCLHRHILCIQKCIYTCKQLNIYMSLF